MTRLRKWAVWRRVAAMSARASSSEASSPTAPSRTWIVIRCLMLWSAPVARVRVALSETLEVSAASTRSRSSGSVDVEVLVRRRADAVTGRWASQRAARRGRGRTTRRVLLRQLSAQARPRGAAGARLVVVAVDGGRRAAVQERVGAVVEGAACRPGRPARPRARGAPAGRSARRASAGAPRPATTAAWCSERAVVRTESTTVIVEHRAKVTRIATTDERPRDANGLKACPRRIVSAPQQACIPPR